MYSVPLFLSVFLEAADLSSVREQRERPPHLTLLLPERSRFLSPVFFFFFAEGMNECTKGDRLFSLRRYVEGMFFFFLVLNLFLFSGIRGQHP